MEFCEMKKLLVPVLLSLTAGCVHSDVGAAPAAASQPAAQSERKNVPAPAPAVAAAPSVSSSAAAPASAVEEKKNYGSAEIRRAANTVVNNMVRSGALDNPTGDRYVVTTGRFVNKTKETFKTDEIVADVKSALAATRKVRVVGAGSKNPAPKLIVTGTVKHRIGHIRGKERHEYYLQLNVTDLRSGTLLWEGETPIVRKSVKDNKTR